MKKIRPITVLLSHCLIMVFVRPLLFNINCLLSQENIYITHIYVSRMERFRKRLLGLETRQTVSTCRLALLFLSLATEMCNQEGA